jgi:6-phosphogluconate dehydrogenase
MFTMKIAVSGLGRMGGQIARKLTESGHSVVAHNRSREPIAEAVGQGAVAAYTKEDVVAQFDHEPLVVWIMLPAEIIDAELDAWLSLVPKGSLLIDGGNSDFRLTRERAKRVDTAGCRLVDCGTSGGVWGYENGFSMMVGGDGPAVAIIKSALDSLALPEGAWRHFGPSGSGHFVKMVHNAIEYGMMESLAEGYRMLREGPYPGLDLAEAGEVWQHHSVVTSWLNELTRESLRENPNLDGIDGIVAESGEARWTLEAAKSAGIPLPSIQAAFDVRLASQRGEVSFATQLLAAMRNKFGGHALNDPTTSEPNRRDSVPTT